MGKVVKVIATVVGVALLVIPGVGQALGAQILSSAFAVGGTLGAAMATAGSIMMTALAIQGISGAIGFATGALGLGPKPAQTPRASTDRLKASLDPRAARKIVFGYTAAATDVHYQEFTGTDQERLHSIIVLASHAIESIEEVWFDETKVLDGVTQVDPATSTYFGFTYRTEGLVGSAFTISGSTSWVSSTCRLVGCAYLYFNYWVGSQESPFSQNVTSRITVRVKGAKLYDPRHDTTAGGSGSMRADDQSTWQWLNDDMGRSPALQLLWYLLGWRIQNPADSTWKLAVGLGLPKARIDMASFIAAANICDEAVTLAGGGTEPRYRSDGVFSEDDAPEVVFGNLLAAMNGVLRDAGGKLVLEVLHNDLGSPVADFTQADVIGEFTWLQTPPIDQSFNVVRGKYVDATDAGLYQMVDYPDVTITSPDGIDRPKTFDYAMVQSASQAQRLAKQFLQRGQYPGTFTADFLASAWRCQVGSVVRLTFPALGFSNKLFRVVEHSIRFDGRCPMVLREENAAIYAWSAEETAPVVAAAPITYNPLNAPVPRLVNLAIGSTGDINADRVDTIAIVDGAVSESTFDEWSDTRALASSLTDYRYATQGGLIFPSGGNVHIHAELVAWLTYSVAGLSVGDVIGAEIAITRWDGGAPGSTEDLADYVTAGATVLTQDNVLLQTTYDGTVTSGSVETEHRNLTIDYLDTSPGTDGVWYAVWAKMISATGTGSFHTDGYQRVRLLEVKK
jgi:hypothetical protein